MMTSSNGNIFRVTGSLCGEFTGHQWFPLTTARDAELWCFLWSATWIIGWVNNRQAGDLRRHRSHYDVIVIQINFTGAGANYCLHLYHLITREVNLLDLSKTQQSSNCQCFQRNVQYYPDSKVHGANMGPTWVLSAPDGPHVGPMNLAIRVVHYVVFTNHWYLKSFR